MGSAGQGQTSVVVQAAWNRTLLRQVCNPQALGHPCVTGLHHLLAAGGGQEDFEGTSCRCLAVILPLRASHPGHMC